MMRWETLCRSPCARYGAVAVVAIVVYLNALSGDFIYDDRVSILENADVQGEGSWSDLFKHNFWGRDITSENSLHKSYRPLVVLTFRWNQSLFGSDTFSWHVFNTLLHAAVSVLVTILAGHLYSASAKAAQKQQSSRVAKKDGDGDSTNEKSLLAGILFATHPIHTEAVVNLTGRADVMCAFFSLIGFILYCQHRWSTGAKSTKTTAQLLTGYVLCLLAAHLCKETAIAIPVIVVVLEVLNGHFVSPFAIYSIAVVAGNIGLRKHFFDVLDFPPHITENPVHHQVPLTQVLSYAHLHSVYFNLLVFPIRLCADYSMMAIPLVESFADPRLLVVAASYAVVLTGTVAALKRFRQDDSVELTCVLWGVLPFVPASNIIHAVSTVVGERLLYLPSVGFVLYVVHVAHRLLTKSRAKLSLCLLLVSLSGLYSVQTLVRNPVWNDREHLWTDTIQCAPGSHRANVAIHDILSDSMQYDQADAYIARALEIYPEDVMAMMKHSRSLMDRSLYRQAEAVLEKALDLEPTYIDGAMAMIQAKTHLKDVVSVRRLLKEFESVGTLEYWVVRAESETRLRLATADHTLAKALEMLEQSPDFPMLVRMGNIYGARSDHGKAVECYERAIALRADEPGVWANLMNALMQSQKYEKALEIGGRSLQKWPQAHMVLYQMALTHYFRGDMDSVWAYLDTTLKVAPELVQAHYLKANVYIARGETLQAKKVLHSILRSHPEFTAAQDTLDSLE